jgi:hypothetical protein
MVSVLLTTPMPITPMTTSNKAQPCLVEQHRPSYRCQGDVSVGAELPEAGVTYYEVPQEYGAREYRYTVVNDRPVLVDPRTRRHCRSCRVVGPTQTIPRSRSANERLFFLR